jgi:hypothetical protein
MNAKRSASAGSSGSDPEYAGFVVFACRRIHRRPTMLEAFEGQPLHPTFVNDREQLVLDLRAAA